VIGGGGGGALAARRCSPYCGLVCIIAHRCVCSSAVKINLIASRQPMGFAPGLASGLGPQIGFLRTLRAHYTSPLAPSCSIPSAKMQATAVRSSVTRVALASE
jgi:hypothetical protein